MSEQYELTLNDYLSIARRRWAYLVFPFVLVFVASVAVALLAPPIYQSSGTILVESQQIPDDLVRSTVTSYADERIQVITQTVMTRSNLLAIVEKFNLFAERRNKLTVSEQIDLIRSSIRISRQDAGSFRSNNRNNSNTLTFSVGFESSSPDLALAVTNELFTLFQEENARSRTERASETTEFLSQEADRLEKLLEDIENEIAAYKQENRNALPEHLELHQSQLQRTEASIKDVERAISEAGDELRFLEIELSAVNVGAISGGSATSYASPAQALAAAEAELVALQARYTENHPDVRRLKRQIVELRAEAASVPAEDGASDIEIPENIDVARIQARIDSVNARVSSLEEQKTQLEANRHELEAVIIQTPQVQRALVSKNRDYENIRRQYEEIQAKEMTARLGESMEEGKKAERFLALERPVRPDKPIKPNRKKIVAMGFFLALASSVGLTALLEMGDKRIRGVDALAAILNERPLVAIPYISINDEIRKTGRTRKWLLASFIIAIPIILVGIHFLYMPLDLLVIKIVARFG